MTCNKKVNVACIPYVSTDEDIIKPQEAEKQQEST